MCLTADQGVASSIPARPHAFMEIDHQIISTAVPGLEIFVWTYSSCGASCLNFSLVLTPIELVLKSGFKKIFQQEYNSKDIMDEPI